MHIFFYLFTWRACTINQKLSKYAQSKNQKRKRKSNTISIYNIKNLEVALFQQAAEALLFKSRYGSQPFNAMGLDTIPDIASPDPER